MSDIRLPSLAEHFSPIAPSVELDIVFMLSIFVCSNRAGAQGCPLWIQRYWLTSTTKSRQLKSAHGVLINNARPSCSQLGSNEKQKLLKAGSRKSLILEQEKAFLEERLRILEARLGDTHRSPPLYMLIFILEDRSLPGRAMCYFRGKMHSSRHTDEPIIFQEPEQEGPAYEPPMPATPQRKTRSKASMASTPGIPPTARTTRKQASSNTW
ncbi:hypothetical protein CPC08DRAFT_771539 [Agrocybe pediades]|nr:hypothetical protein CPC08DRAFT_771539 [Agrocybe pediades]